MSDDIHHPILARLLDLSMRPLQKFRPRVIDQARGEVLEIGVGTGLNLPLYDPDKVTRLVGIEPDRAMRKRAARRAGAVPFELKDAQGETLPFDDNRFDTVVLTFVLCTVKDPQATLSEIKRVLRPDGQLLFAEHVRSPRPFTARVQGALTPAWKHFAGGCHLDRDAGALIAHAGFALDDEHRRGSDWSISPVHYGRAVVGPTR